MKIIMDAPVEARHMINLNVEGKPPCQLCNPITPCSKGDGICEECFQWLEKQPKQ